MTAPKLVTRWLTWAPQLQSLLRIVAAFMFIQAGTMKLFAFPIGMPPDVQAKIARVFAGLSYAVEIKGELSVRMNLEERMHSSHIPAVGIAVIEDGKIQWTRYVGVKETGSSTFIDSTTRFMAKSLAKPVVAFASLLLVQEGVLALDTALNRYLTSWKIPANEFTSDSAPTLRQLLSHSAGFTLHGVPSYKVGEPLPSLLQALDGTPPAKPNPVRIDYVPGTKTRYSGGGYSVLQQLLVDITGESFPSLMQRLVLKPMGMNFSLFDVGMPHHLVPRAAVGHGNNGKSIVGKWEALVQMAAGGLITTPNDMARFVIEVIDASNGESRLLSKSLAGEMLTPSIDIWGLGFEVREERNARYFSHTGSGDGFRSIFVGFPSSRQGAVILTNGDGGSEIRYEILRSIAREYNWPAFQVIEKERISLDSLWIARLVGSYEYSDGSVTEVFKRDGRLFTRWRSLEPVEIYAESPHFFFTRSNEKFEFIMDRQTSPNTLKWSGTFGEFVGKKRR